MTSPNAPFALRGLGSVLSADLDRSTVREWLGEKQRAALERPSAALGSALETVGRLLRSGDLAPSSRDQLKGWWEMMRFGGKEAAALVGSVVAFGEKRVQATSSCLAGFLAENAPAREALTLALATPPALGPAVALSDAWCQELVQGRDDIESCVVALGHAALAEVPGAAEGEQRLLQALGPVDVVADELEDEIGKELPKEWQDPWLARIGRVDDSCWWLQILAAQEIRRDPRVVRTLERLASRPARSKVLRLPKSRIEASASLMMGKNEAGGIDVLLEKPLGPAIAQLFGDAVEVYAIGAATNAISGLVVREREGHLARIVDVRLSPPGPAAPLRSEVDLAFWVPLAGAAETARHLVVSYAREAGAPPEEESLSLEFE